MPGPTYTALTTFGATLVDSAVRQLWPDDTITRLTPVPSLNSLLYRVDVEDRRLVAKVPVMGVPVATALRGTYGPLEQLQSRMRAHLATTAPPTHAQHTHLKHLTAAGLPAAGAAGYARGVLFTPASPDTEPLADLLREEPCRATDLLPRALAAVAPVSGGALPPVTAPGCQITNRLLHGLSAQSTWRYHLQRTDRIPTSTLATIEPVITASMRTLIPLVRELPGRPVLTFGALQPDHLLYDDTRDQLTLLSPALQWSNPYADLARLISRTTLLILTDSPATAVGRKYVLTALAHLLDDQAARQSPERGAQMLRAVLALWAADTAHHLVSILSTPSDLPLGVTDSAVATHCRLMCTLLHRVTTAAALDPPHPQAAWHDLFATLNTLH
ncbi:hypothetical protein ABT160_28560 [Streptomyces sp. NPDC001941]|uniref:hypothetical protein n=1 Tax=Streptomyces sp. NPDC001941 TaxID=3154659 RepID=UPI00332AB464